MNSDHSTRGDRLTKQIVICTLCLMAGGMVATVCSLALRQLPIAPEIERMATYIIGVLSGMLIKTGVDATAAGAKVGPVPVVTEPGQPLETVEAQDPATARD